MKFRHLFASMLAIAVAVVACEDPNADPQNPNPDQDPGTTPGEEQVVQDGTEENPYLLKTVADLQAMMEKAPLKAETYFRLENDIDMSEVTNWVPVNYAEPFERIIHFDGNDKTISNFKPSTWVDGEGEATGYPSFFGVLVGSCKDLTIADAAIEEASATTGILAGYVGTSFSPVTARITTNVTNVKVSGEISTTVNKAGGMAGACYNANFENCQAEVSVRTASTDAGGFVGQLDPKGTNTFKNCTAKTTLTSLAGDKCRCGGFIGWNRSLNTTIDNCRVLNGSTITDESGRTDKQMPMYGGFIAFADNSYPDQNDSSIEPSVLTVRNSSADIIVDAGPMSRVNSLFIAQTGYQSTITLENCTAKGKVTSGDNYAGGLLGYKNSAATGTVTITGCTCEGEVSAGYGAGGIVGGVEGGTVIISDSKVIGTITCGSTRAGGLIGLAGKSSTTEITDSYFDGTITGQGYLGGAIGGIADNSVKSTIDRTYSKGSITGTSNYVGGLVGAAQSPVQSVSDCYSIASVASASDTKQAGGLVGTATTKITVTNCFASGNVTVGTVAAGLVGRIGAAESTVSKCIAWNSKVEALASSLSGAIIGSLEKSGTYSDCARRSDLVVKVAGETKTVPDQDNITTVSSAIAYNGKAAAANATLSSVAKSLGWSEEVWDLTKDVPSLK